MKKRIAGLVVVGLLIPRWGVGADLEQERRLLEQELMQKQARAEYEQERLRILEVVS